MAEKIRIKSLQKTDDYIDREWGQITSQRQYLLTSTDWTQLEDNELTFESRVRWNDWRKKVRLVKRATVGTIEEAEQILKNLEKNTPERVFIESNTMRQKKYQMDIETLPQAKTDATNILKQLHGDWCINLMPENYNLILGKHHEMLRFYSAKPKAKNFSEYPLLEATQETYGWDIYEVLEHVMNLKRSSDELLVMIEYHRHKFIQKINEAKTIDEVINVVKLMHGY